MRRARSAPQIAVRAGALSAGRGGLQAAQIARSAIGLDSLRVMATHDGDARGGAAGAADGARLATHERRLRLFLLHQTGPVLRARVELDDLAQEVYLRALKSARGLPDGEGALWGLLARLAREVVIDAAR